MASKFQNRLVGTIVLVALGVIVLPGLLDGQKKHYQDEFAAIPLVPKAGDRDEPDMMPAATQALPTQPPEGAAEEVRAGDAAAPSLDPATIAANNTEFEPEPAPVVPPKPKPVESPKPKVEAPPAPKPEPKPVVEEKAAPTGKAYVVQLGALKNADKVNEIVGKLRGVLIVAAILFFLDSFTGVSKSEDWSKSQLIPQFSFIIRWFFDYLQSSSSFLPRA